MEEILRRMQLIRDLFMETQSFCISNNDLELIQDHLGNINSPFCSIAYESASMAIAIKNFELRNDTTVWETFVSGPAKIHQAQVYIGLGWAIAKLNISFLSIAEKFDAATQHYTADGCGYYDASFRQRQTILNQQLPGYLPAALLCAYDEGIGRSLMYTYNADIDKVKNKIETFSTDRQASLWKGVGIAVAYMGGCNDKSLNDIFVSTGEYAVQLAEGGALAVKSRTAANTLTTDTNHCVMLWTSLSAVEEKK